MTKVRACLGTSAAPVEVAGDEPRADAGERRHVGGGQEAGAAREREVPERGGERRDDARDGPRQRGRAEEDERACDARERRARGAEPIREDRQREARDRADEPVALAVPGAEETDP